MAYPRSHKEELGERNYLSFNSLHQVLAAGEDLGGGGRCSPGDMLTTITTLGVGPFISRGTTPNR